MKSLADRALEHVEHLSVQIGTRPIGSPANLAAADYISKVFMNCGLSVTITSFAGSPEFETLIDRKLMRYPGVMKVEPWPASDHYIFYSNGTPSIALTSMGIKDIFHTLSDTFVWISGEKLAEATRLVLDLFEELDSQDLSWTRSQK